MANNYFGRELATFERHQHAAACERIDERSSIADREQARCGCGTLATETLPRSAQPFGAGLRRFERVARAWILHHHLAHHAFRIGVAALHVLGADNEAKIARSGFDVAQSAVAAGVEIDLTRTWR